MSITVGTVSSGGAGSVGPAGPQGDPGPAGAGFTNRGAWSTANSYAARDVVTWQGSAFVALNAVAAGGANPRADAANWLVWAQGGGEIAYAEARAPYAPAAGQLVSTAYDVPGLTIPIPAGTGPYEITAILPGVQVSTSSSGIAGDYLYFRLLLVDESNMIQQTAIQQVRFTAASQSLLFPMSVDVRMPATAAAKTFKATYIFDSITQSHVTSPILWAGASNVAVPASGVGISIGAIGPMSLKATAR